MFVLQFQSDFEFTFMKQGPPKRDNNAETAPGLPQVEAVYVAPLTCPEGQILQDGKCVSLNKKKTVKVTAV